MTFKFEKLEVWELALEYIDVIYDYSKTLPGDEKYNLTAQIRRAATSIALNIAEGSTGQTDAEQSRFLGMAIRSVIETVACLIIIKRRGYGGEDAIKEIYKLAEKLAAKIHALRRSINPSKSWIREEEKSYLPDKQ